MSEPINITDNVRKLLALENTKIGKKIYDIMDRDEIAGIVKDNNVFYFEFYGNGNYVPEYVYEYLKRFIKRKLKLEYLYDYC